MLNEINNIIFKLLYKIFRKVKENKTTETHNLVPNLLLVEAEKKPPWPKGLGATAIDRKRFDYTLPWFAVLCGRWIISDDSETLKSVS